MARKKIVLFQQGSGPTSAGSGSNAPPTSSTPSSTDWSQNVQTTPSRTTGASSSRHRHRQHTHHHPSSSSCSAAPTAVASSSAGVHATHGAQIPDRVFQFRDDEDRVVQNRGGPSDPERNMSDNEWIRRHYGSRPAFMRRHRLRMDEDGFARARVILNVARGRPPNFGQVRDNIATWEAEQEEMVAQKAAQEAEEKAAREATAKETAEKSAEEDADEMKKTSEGSASGDDEDESPGSDVDRRYFSDEVSDDEFQDYNDPDPWD